MTKKSCPEDSQKEKKKGRNENIGEEGIRDRGWCRASRLIKNTVSFGWEPHGPEIVRTGRGGTEEKKRGRKKKEFCGTGKASPRNRAATIETTPCRR